MKINDVAELVGVSASTLRYWEKKLTLDVPRDEYGSRTFTTEWVAYFKQVKALLDEDLGWSEIGEKLKQPSTPDDAPPVEPPAPPVKPEPPKPDKPSVDPDEFEKWKTQVQKKFDVQSKVITSLQTDQKTLQGSNKALEKQVAGLQGEITALEATLTPLQKLQKNFWGLVFGIFIVFFLTMVAVHEGFG